MCAFVICHKKNESKKQMWHYNLEMVRKQFFSSVPLILHNQIRFVIICWDRLFFTFLFFISWKNQKFVFFGDQTHNRPNEEMRKVWIIKNKKVSTKTKKKSKRIEIGALNKNICALIVTNIEIIFANRISIQSQPSYRNKMVWCGVVWFGYYCHPTNAISFTLFWFIRFFFYIFITIVPRNRFFFFFF